MRPWLALALLATIGGPLAGRSHAPSPDSLRGQLLAAWGGEPAAVRSAVKNLLDGCAEDTDCLVGEARWALENKDSLGFQVYERAGFRLLASELPQRALGVFREALAAAEQRGDDFHIGVFNHHLGYVYTHTNNQTDSAAHYLYISIAAYEKGDAFHAWRCYYSLSHVYRYLGQDDRSLEAVEKAYLLAREGGARMDYGFALFHLLQVAFAQGREGYIDKYWPDYEAMRNSAGKLDLRHDALLEYLRGDDLALAQLARYLNRNRADVEENDRINLGFLFGTLSAGYRRQGRLEEATAALRQAIKYDLAIGRQGNAMEQYQALAELGELRKDPELILEGLRGYQALRDSLAQDAYQANISRLEVEFETQKTEAELARSELALSEARRQRNLLQVGGVALLALLVAGFLFYQNRLKLQRLRATMAREEQARELREVRRQGELDNLRALIEGQETERTRVAKDLHDGLGGLLTTVKAHLQDPASAGQAVTLIDRACTSVRHIAHNMVPHTLAQAGFAASLNDLAAQLRVQGYEVDLEIVGQPAAHLDLHQQSILLRIAQELTHNVVKHAAATSLLLQLFVRDGRLLLTVEDDGSGFNLDHARREGKGMGLRSVEQRVAYLQGEILYDSRPGKGTTVSVDIPVGEQVGELRSRGGGELRS